MMWSFVNSDGDVLPQKFHGPAHLLSINTPEGCIAVAGNIDHLSQRFENGRAVEFQPPQPSADHEWNETIKRWVLTQAEIDRKQAIASAHGTIKALESKQSRALREAFLNPTEDTRQRVADIDAQIAEQRSIIQVNSKS